MSPDNQQRGTVPGASDPAGPALTADVALAGPGWAMGLDIGGTLMKAVVAGPDGAIDQRVRRPTGASRGPAAVLDNAVDLLEQVRTGLGPGRPLAATGIAVPGFVDEAAGVARYSANIGWHDLEVARLVGDRAGVLARLGHDLRLGGRAEGALGAARGYRDFMFVAVGTGIAAAITLNGEQRQGAAGVAGEIGHVVVAPGGAPCGCGGRGCLEAVASAGAIARLYHLRAGGPPVGADEVVARAQHGDAVAAEVWATAVGHLATALAQAQSTLDLQLIVVGGGLAGAGPSLLGPLAEGIAARLPCLPAPPLAPALLGDEAAGLGAALLARAAQAGPATNP
jgi:glucokinase